MNSWYLIAIEDKSKYFGYNSILNKGQYYITLEEAEIERIYYQPDYKEKLVILKRTCEVLK